MQRILAAIAFTCLVVAPAIADEAQPVAPPATVEPAKPCKDLAASRARAQESRYPPQPLSVMTTMAKPRWTTKNTEMCSAA